MSFQILEKLFNSKIQVKVMKILINNPEKKFRISELAKKIKSTLPTTKKELNKLQKIRFISTNLKKKKRYYSLNQNFTLYPELKKIFLKIEPPENKQILKQIKKVGNIKLVILGGIFTQDKKSQTDIMLVGEKINSRKLKRFLENLEAELGREINYTLMNIQEFFYRQDMYDKFLINFLERPHKVLMDKLKIKNKK